MRVIKRKKGSRTYFYLQHSFRKGGRVVTRERYLGRRIPKDVDSLKAALLREARSGISAEFERIRRNFRKEWRTYPRTVREREKAEIAIAFTYNTNAIEGSTITLDEARGIIRDQVSPNKPLKDIRETESHGRVFLEMLDMKRPVTNRVLRLWHLRIFQETKPDIAGRYRRYLVRVGNHVAPDWKKVNALMNRYITFISRSDTPAVELAARAHYRFEKIHPFGDGNGRIGRLVMNWLLWRHGYPMMIIEYRKRAAYYRALGRDEEGFVGYFLRTYLKAHRTWIR